MIKVNVLFFASIRNLVKKKSEEITLSEGALVRDLKTELIMRYPNSKTAIQSILTAVNREFADEETALSDGDEVALFAHVSGG